MTTSPANAPLEPLAIDQLATVSGGVPPAPASDRGGAHGVAQGPNPLAHAIDESLYKVTKYARRVIQTVKHC